MIHDCKNHKPSGDPGSHEVRPSRDAHLGVEGATLHFRVAQVPVPAEASRGSRAPAENIVPWVGWLGNDGFLTCLNRILLMVDG